LCIFTPRRSNYVLSFQWESWAMSSVCEI